MILISHRGNINKPTEMENHPTYIHQAISVGYDVEIDVRFLNDEFWLGHDAPQYKVNGDFLKTKGLWIHAKNIEAAARLVTMDVNWFWHQEDDLAITSKGYIWCYPGKEICGGIMNTNSSHMVEGVIGICSDYIAEWKKI